MFTTAMSWIVRISLLITLFACARANAQCQDQECVFGNSGCYQCGRASGFTCSVPQGQRYSRQCTVGYCGPAFAPFPGKRAASCAPDSSSLFKSVSQLRSSLDTLGDAKLSVTFFPGRKQDPIVLTSITTDADRDVLKSGVLRNQGSVPVVSYRIGWFVVPRPASAAASQTASASLVRTGRQINVPEGIAAATNAPVVGQGVDTSIMTLKNRAVIFYVAEAELSDGRFWSADTEAIKKNLGIN